MGALCRDNYLLPPVKAYNETREKSASREVIIIVMCM